MKTLKEKIVRKGLRIVCIWAGTLQMALAQSGYGEIRGTIKNENNEEVPFATIQILQGTRFIGGTKSDMSGAYVYKPLEPGIYEMLIQESGHQTKRVNKIKVSPEEVARVNVLMASNTLTDITVTATIQEVDYTNTGVDQNVFQMKTLSAEEILQQASGNRGDIISILPSMTAEIIEDSGGGLHFRGGRSGSSAYFVDGVRVTDIGTLPGLAIDNLTVFTGGVPAAYGDTAGGVVIVTTKSYFSGIRDKRIRSARIKENYKEQQKQKRQTEEQNQEASELN